MISASVFANMQINIVHIITYEYLPARLFRSSKCISRATYTYICVHVYIVMMHFKIQIRFDVIIE